MYVALAEFSPTTDSNRFLADEYELQLFKGTLVPLFLLQQCGTICQLLASLVNSSLLLDLE